MSFCDQTIQQYVDQAASDAATPGGGSISALGAALGNAMAAMAANFTVGKKKYGAVEQEIREILTHLATHRDALLMLMQQDADAFAAVNEAYALPRDTDENKTVRNATIQTRLAGAMTAPLAIMRSATASLERLPRLAEIGNPNLISDTGVAAILLEAAVRAAELNVLVNLKFLTDTTTCERAATETTQLREKTLTLYQETDTLVRKQISSG